MFVKETPLNLIYFTDCCNGNGGFGGFDDGGCLATSTVVL
jgi:hypothetical protein